MNFDMTDEAQRLMEEKSLEVSGLIHHMEPEKILEHPKLNVAPRCDADYILEALLWAYKLAKREKP